MLGQSLYTKQGRLWHSDSKLTKVPAPLFSYSFVAANLRIHFGRGVERIPETENNHLSHKTIRAGLGTGYRSSSCRGGQRC